MTSCGNPECMKCPTVIPGCGRYRCPKCNAQPAAQPKKFKYQRWLKK